MVQTPKVFGIREAKYNRNSNRIQKDRKVATAAIRSTSSGDEWEDKLDSQYEEELKQLSQRSNKNTRTPVLGFFTGNNNGDSEEEPEPMYTYHVKLLLLGDSNVGKSCVLTRYASNRFDTSLIPTTGVDFKTRFLSVNVGDKKDSKDSKKVKCQVWDTAGQERFRLITRAYYRGAHGIVLVYDCTDRKSFEHLSDWIEAIKNYADKAVRGCVFCNKTDLPQESHVVTREEGLSVTKKLEGFKFFETSAKSGKNVISSLDELARECIEHKVVKALPNLTTTSTSSSGDSKPRRAKRKKGMCKQQ
jgi:small GTP-binding protein